MAEMIMPQKVQANGNDSWWWVPAIADMAAPKASEINASTALNITCFLLAEQEGFASETERVTLPRFLCETSTEEGEGEQKFSLPDMQMAFDPQAADTAAGKKAWVLFKSGAAGYVVRRQGVEALASPEVEAGEFVDVAKATTNRKAMPGKTSTGAEAIYSFTVNVFVKGKPELNVAVVV